MTDTLKLAMLLSGTGRSLENILAWIRDGRLDAAVVAVASNRADVRGVQVGEEADVPTRVFLREDHPTRKARDAAMFDWLAQRQPELYVTAGYLALLDLAHATAPVLNIHPSLLPRHGGGGYYGLNVHQAVVDAGDRESGATVHVVNARYDDGPIVARVRVPVPEGATAESLSVGVFSAECRLLPTVLGWVATGELRFERGMPMGRTGPWRIREITPA